MSAEIIVSVHADNKTLKDRIGVCSFKSRSLFWGFEWNERSNNQEKNSNTSYRSETQYILCVVVGT